MARISTYPIDGVVSLTDILVGSEAPNPGGPTKNYQISDILALVSSNLADHADNAAAVTAGLAVGALYRTAGDVKVVI